MNFMTWSSTTSLEIKPSYGRIDGEVEEGHFSLLLNYPFRLSVEISSPVAHALQNCIPFHIG